MRSRKGRKEEDINENCVFMHAKDRSVREAEQVATAAELNMAMKPYIVLDLLALFLSHTSQTPWVEESVRRGENESDSALRQWTSAHCGIDRHREFTLTHVHAHIHTHACPLKHLIRKSKYFQTVAPLTPTFSSFRNTFEQTR